jgi:hypothetical protein
MKRKQATNLAYSRSSWEPTIDELMTSRRGAQATPSVFEKGQLIDDAVADDPDAPTVELLAAEILFPEGSSLPEGSNLPEGSSLPEEGDKE